MTLTKETYILAAIALAVGLFLGTQFCPSRDRLPPRGMHQMERGEMMHNDMMDHGRMNMEDMMISMTKNLAGKTGDTFDQAFIEEMIPHHQGAVEMAELVLTSTERPELRQLAREIIDAQTKEIEMMKAWQDTWFNN